MDNKMTPNKSNKREEKESIIQPNGLNYTEIQVAMILFKRANKMQLSYFSAIVRKREKKANMVNNKEKEGRKGIILKKQDNTISTPL